MSRRQTLLRGGLGGDSDEMDPLGFPINLFDMALVFALALMIALVSNLKMADLLTSKDFTVVKNPGRADMEIITREGGYVPGDAPAGSRQCQRVGTAYRLESGEIVYVPEAGDGGAGALATR